MCSHHRCEQLMTKHTSLLCSERRVCLAQPLEEPQGTWLGEGYPYPLVCLLGSKKQAPHASGVCSFRLKKTITAVSPGKRLNSFSPFTLSGKTVFAEDASTSSCAAIGVVSVCPCHSPALEGAEGPSRGQCPHLLPLKTRVCHRQAFWLHVKIIWEYPGPRRLLSRLSGCEPGCGGEVPQGLPSPAQMDNLPEGSLASIAPSRWVWRSSSSRLQCWTSSGERHPRSHSDRGAIGHAPERPRRWQRS